MKRSAKQGAKPKEVRFKDPKTGGEKGMKIARFDLVPILPQWRKAVVFGRGSLKYEDRNWEKGYPWSLSIAALYRHLLLFLAGESRDEETDAHHMAQVGWHADVLQMFELMHADKDDRSKWTGDLRVLKEMKEDIRAELRAIYATMAQDQPLPGPMARLLKKRRVELKR